MRPLIACVSLVLCAAGCKPEIVHDASGEAVADEPYRYNERQAITLKKPAPGGFMTCVHGNDDGRLSVDRATGQVSWTPLAPGKVALCVRVVADGESDQYDFTVNVKEGATSSAQVRLAQIATWEQNMRQL